MKTNNIEKLLGKQFCIDYNLDTKKKYEIEFINARELITSKRIDLIAKYKYVQAKDNNYDGSFFDELYKSHLDAFTCGTFTEDTQKDTKNSLKAYVDSFNNLIDDIRTNGVNPEKSVIPVGRDNGIMDGAHRVSIAAYYNQQIPIIRLDNLDANDNAEAFEKKCMPRQLVQYLVSEYCSMKDDIYTACLWPISNRKDNLHSQVDEIFKANCRIVYKTKINVDIHMLRNFMIQVYSGFDWLGALDSHFSGATTYAEQVNDSSQYLTLYVLENASLDTIKDVKNQIRELYGFGNATMHISDTHEEAMNIIHMLLNENSLHCLKYAEPDKYKKFNFNIESLKNEIKELNINPDDLILDSGSVLSLYGLRETNDIDYISNYDYTFKNPLIQKHNDDEYFYLINQSDLLYNPNNYLYYYGLKFVEVSKLLEMKKSRYSTNKDSKDKDDINLLDSINNKKYENIRKAIYWTKRQARNIKYKIITMIIHSPFYKPLRFIYYKIKK